MTLADYRKQHGEPLTEEDEHSGGDTHHPSALEYIQIGAILTFVTALEVALYYIDMNYTLLVTMLIVLSLAKFALVVLWFMHLRFDNKLFGILFASGMALTFTVFAVVIAAQHGGLV
ncbi:MAG TPA: cytochrome C oxidase subunit IV family protein [Dehalococcoidia bacterium]|nr:cytochrome C oxidase subunit IV family protein [Dehalococcoidia bacterium]